jgi:haloalkane dehalogenase
LEALLERVVPEAPIHLAVHDIGGPVGLMWAIRNPDRLASLLILNTTLFLELFRPPRVALISLVPVVGPRAVAATLSRESEFKRVILRPCARSIDPATLDALYGPYRQPDACRAAALTWSAFKRGFGDFVRARRALPRLRLPRPSCSALRPALHSRQRPRVRITHSKCPPAPARRCRALHPTEAPTEVADELKSLLQRAQ